MVAAVQHRIVFQPQLPHGDRAGHGTLEDTGGAVEAAALEALSPAHVDTDQLHVRTFLLLSGVMVTQNPLVP